MALITISPMPMVSPRTVLVLAGSTHRAAFRERRLRMVSDKNGIMCCCGWSLSDGSFPKALTGGTLEVAS
jgi:hypothetical protein